MMFLWLDQPWYIDVLVTALEGAFVAGFVMLLNRIRGPR